MTGSGHPFIQGGAGYGAHGDGAFAYFDKVADLGVVVEVTTDSAAHAQTRPLTLPPVI
jgi:hypothetical protein